jgi:hypothetical protein
LVRIIAIGTEGCRFLEGVMFHARGGRAANHLNAGNVEGKFDEYTCFH